MSVLPRGISSGFLLSHLGTFAEKKMANFCISRAVTVGADFAFRAFLLFISADVAEMKNRSLRLSSF